MAGFVCYVVSCAYNMDVSTPCTDCHVLLNSSGLGSMCVHSGTLMGHFWTGRNVILPKGLRERHR